jgi:hemerythrin-like domain-containing protein
MKQDIQLLAETLEEAYKALQQGDKDIALACIAYAQTIINGTNREV